MTWVKQLKTEYADSARRLQQYRDRLIQTDLDAEMHPDMQIVEDMLADLHYSLEWLQTGRQPNRRRGVDIHDAYSRAILMDMDLMPEQVVERQELRVTEAQKVELVRILMRMSARERQCFLLHTAYGLSERDIAEELKLTRRTVRTNIQRAKSKVGQAI